MKHLTLIFVLTLLLTACGGGGNAAQGTAAVETAVAEMLAAQNQAPAGETPIAEQPAGAEPTATLDQNIDANLVALVNTCIPTTTLQVRARVESVNNGDSVVVHMNGQTYDVRYIGVDAPEGSEAGAAEALAANKALVEGRDVLLIMDETDVDEYGRLVRYVVVDNTFVNLELVSQGVAFPSSEEPDTSCDSAIANAR